MNEFERKIYLKYANIENMTQLLCLKLYRLRLFIQVNVLLFLLFYFFKTSFGIAQDEFKELSNPSSRKNPKLLIKKSSVSYNVTNLYPSTPKL